MSPVIVLLSKCFNLAYKHLFCLHEQHPYIYEASPAAAPATTVRTERCSITIQACAATVLHCDGIACGVLPNSTVTCYTF